MITGNKAERKVLDAIWDALGELPEETRLEALMVVLAKFVDKYPKNHIRPGEPTSTVIKDWLAFHVEKEAGRRGQH